jgi:hypothetical protein
MLVKELIGKRITNIYQIVEYESYGLDQGEAFIELDNDLIIDLPYNNYEEEKTLWEKELKDEAVSLFSDLSDRAFYHLDKDFKRIIEVKKNVTITRFSFWERVKYFIETDKWLPAKKETVEETEVYKADYVENQLKYIKDRIITDVLFFNGHEKVFLELDNGYIITEVTAGMNGTGRVGIHIFKNLVELIKRKGFKFIRVSNPTQEDEAGEIS